MPVYEYECGDCGVFEAVKPMRQFNVPCDCPACGTSAPRVMLTSPRLGAVSARVRHAHETNERSAGTPKRSARGPDPVGRSDGLKMPSKAMHRPDGSKSFPSQRPWMLSH